MERREAYKIALENEIKSINLYKILSKSFNDQDIIDTFNSLASLELIHKEKLIQACKKEFGHIPFNYNDNDVPKIDIRRNLSDAKSILEYAIDREIAMADQYKIMAEESEDEMNKKFFLDLVQEEIDHKDLLETELNRIQGSMIWFDDSELNGLMED